MHKVIANGSFCASGLSIPIAPPMRQGTNETTANTKLKIANNIKSKFMLYLS